MKLKELIAILEDKYNIKIKLASEIAQEQEEQEDTYSLSDYLDFVEKEND